MASDEDSPGRIPADQVDALIDAACAALDLAHQHRTAGMQPGREVLPSCPGLCQLPLRYYHPASVPTA